MIVGAVGSGDTLLVSSGQTGAGLQADVGGVCLGYKILIVIGVIVICIAMGVEEYDTAGFQRIGNCINRRFRFR